LVEFLDFVEDMHKLFTECRVCTRRGESQGSISLQNSVINEFSQPLIQYFCRQIWSLVPLHLVDWSLLNLQNAKRPFAVLSTIPATVAGFTKLCDWLRAEISIIRTKKVGFAIDWNQAIKPISVHLLTSKGVFVCSVIHNLILNLFPQPHCNDDLTKFAARLTRF